MEEKTYIEKLEEFAKETGYNFITNSDVEDHLLFSQDNRFTKSDFVVFDLENILKNLYFVFSDRYSTKAYTGETYCGLYCEIPECKNEIKIIRRDWFDALSFNKRFKTGDKFVDKNVTLFKENYLKDNLKINSKNIGKFIEINKEIKPLELVTIKNSLSFVPKLHGKNWIALVIKGRWILEIEKLKFIVKKGSELIADIL